MAWRRRIRNGNGDLVNALPRLADSRLARAHVGLLVCPLFNTRDNFRFWLDLACSKREKRLWARRKEERQRPIRPEIFIRNRVV
jgi:hypothetical protein